MVSRLLLSVVGWLAAVTLVGCDGGEESAPNETQDDASDDADPACDRHELRPNRLFEISEALEKLTEDDSDPARKSIYVIPGHWSPFWVTPQEGFAQAKEDLGFSGEFRAACDKSDPTCPQLQVELFGELTDGDASNGEADGIAVGCKDGAAMAAPITKAAKKMPIITFDSDVTTPQETGRALYLGAMNKPAGRAAAETMLDLVAGEGTIHLYADTISTTNVMERAAGVFEVCLGKQFASAEALAGSQHCAQLAVDHICEADCKGEAAGIHLVAHSYFEEAESAADAQDAADSPEAYLERSIATLMSSDDLPLGFMALQNTPSMVISRALANEQPAECPRYVAWDLSEEVQQGLNSGLVDATMVQNSFFYGYLSAQIVYSMAVTDVTRVMEALEPFLETGSDDKLLDTGMTVVTPENLADYQDYQLTCLGVTST